MDESIHEMRAFVIQPPLRNPPLKMAPLVPMAVWLRVFSLHRNTPLLWRLESYFLGHYCLLPGLLDVALTFRCYIWFPPRSFCVTAEASTSGFYPCSCVLVTKQRDG